MVEGWETLGYLIMNAIGWTTGLVSLAITGSDNISIGTAALLFHLAAIAACDKLVREKRRRKAIGIVRVPGR
jgi:hypothetical protein